MVHQTSIVYNGGDEKFAKDVVTAKDGFEYFSFLSCKLRIDSYGDTRRGRYKLARNLKLAAKEIDFVATGLELLYRYKPKLFSGEVFYPGGTQQLALDSGNLRYDALFKITHAIVKAFNKRSKESLGKDESEAFLYFKRKSEAACKYILTSWLISKPFMKLDGSC